VSVKRCLENLTSEYDSWFDVDTSFIQHRSNTCLSLALFKQHPDNVRENQLPLDRAVWHAKYLRLLQKLSQVKTMSVNIHLAYDCQECIPSLLKYPCVNITLMVSKSIGAQPGMMWRFLPLNSGYSRVFVGEIDEPWDWMDLCTNTTFSRPHDVLVSNKAPVKTMSMQVRMIIPKQVDFNIMDVMKGFISLCKKRETMRSCLFDDEPITVWNHPVGDHVVGWGRICTRYGFDELFVKHVLYHHFYKNLKFI
jgi:hypothetical protein